MFWFFRVIGIGFSFFIRYTCRSGFCIEVGNGESLWEGRGLVVVRVFEEWI